MSSNIPTDDGKAVQPPYYGYGYPVDPGSDAGFSIFDILGLARRRWEIIGASILIGTAAAATWGYYQPITYSATAQLLIEADRQVVDLGNMVEGVNSDATAIETQLNLFTSSGFLESFVESERSAELAEDHALRQLAMMKQSVDNEPQKTNAALAQESTDIVTEGTLSADVSRRAAAIADGLRVVQQGRSSIIDIVFTSTNPSEAAKTANELGDFYILDQAKRRQTLTTDASGFLEERLKELEAELLEAEEAVHQYRVANPTSVGNKPTITDERLSELTTELIRTRAERKERQERLVYIRRLSSDGSSLNSLTEVLRSPRMASLWEEESDLRRREAELSIELGANHPRSIALGEERADVELRIASETDRIVENVANEVQVLAQRERSLEKDMTELATIVSEKSTSSDRAAIRLRLLEGKAESTRRIYEEFEIRRKQTREQEAIVEANTRVVASAKVPTIPSSRSPLQIALLGFIGSSAFGLGIAYLRDKADQKLRNGKEIGQALNIPFLGSIPFLSEKDRENRGFHDYLRRKRSSRFAESIRSIYTQMMIGSESEASQKVILITSSVPNEGKTTFVTSLTSMLALDGKKTLLLDLDFRNPSIHGALEPDTDDKLDFQLFLSGKGQKDDPMIIEYRTNFHVVGLESAAKDPGKLLRSSRLNKLIEVARETYDFIVIDGPPSLGLSDSKVLLSLVDTLVFVIRWNDTASNIASEAIEELNRCKAKISGAVLTQVNLKKQSRYGYEGTGYHPGKEQNYYVD